MDENVTDSKTESKVEKIMVAKIRVLYGIIIATLIIGGIFSKIQQDIALIKQNHYTHIETIEKEILALNEKYLELKANDIDLNKQWLDLRDNFKKLLWVHNLTYTEN